MKIRDNIAEYRYSDSTQKPNLYASCYACMIRSLYRDLDTFSQEEKNEWVTYFNSFQSPEDGLFYDPVLNNDLYLKEDWWGARHLALHMIIAYSALDSRPKYDFSFLEPFYDSHYVTSWLESRNWGEKIAFTGNEVMNYGCLLQYSRDFFNNEKAGRGFSSMIEWLKYKINPETGMWGVLPINNHENVSQLVQGAYHFYPLFFYDKKGTPFMEKAIDMCLKTQNKMGGFGIRLNSSACEDIDSIDLLIRFSQKTHYRDDEISLSLKKAFTWILANQNSDGGFVFQRNNPFCYGHEEMYSGINESSMFATWFRTLCLAYLVKYLGLNEDYNIQRLPGYEINIG